MDRPALRQFVGWLGGILVVLSLGSGCDSEQTGGRCSSSTSGICAPVPDAADGGRGADGGCYVLEGACVQDRCDGRDVCRTVPCEIECEPWQRVDGCSCAPQNCSSSEECAGFVCREGTCGECESDEQCGEDRTCQPSGRCLSGSPCDTDQDCTPRKRCSDRGECVDRSQCLVDDDCGEGEICFNGRCTRSAECEDDSDCGEGQECVGDQCFEEVCRGPEDCGEGEICSAGECSEPVQAARCFVATSDATIAENDQVPLVALAVDEEGNGVAANFEWSSSDPSVASIDPGGPFAVGESSSGTATVTAELADSGGVQCSGSSDLTNLGSVQSGNLRVVVTSAEDRQPVSGADVVVPGTGTSTTDSAGVARLPKPSGSYTVSIFHPDFNFLTVRGVGASDLRLPLRGKEGSGPVGGYKGEFDTSTLNTQGDVTLGLAGSSISGGLLEVGLQNLLGRPLVRQIQTPQGNQSIPLPSGLTLFGQVLGFNVDVKSTYYTTAPGGARIGWGLAGKVPGSDLLQLFRGGFDDPVATLLPLFNRFDHAERPLQLMERPRVRDSSDFDGDGDTSEMIPDYQNFPTETLRPSVRQNLVTAVTVSNFPQLPSGRAELAVLVGGNIQPGVGFVPLGISATTDEDGDGVPDLRNLSMAPPHGSISKGRFAVMALAFEGIGFSQQGGVTLPNDFSAALWSRQSLPTSVGLGTFPNATSGTVDKMARTVDLSADAGPLYRFQFIGDQRTWELWTTGPSGSMGSFQHTANIPTVPGSRKDLFANGDQVLVDSVQVSASIDDLVRAKGIGLRGVGRVATAFNRTELD